MRSVFAIILYNYDIMLGIILYVDIFIVHVQNVYYWDCLCYCIFYIKVIHYPVVRNVIVYEIRHKLKYT